MREPWPEQIRRTLEACRQGPARDVLSSRWWAQLREHCGELAVELDALGHRTIAQRVDRDYARLHEQLREATAAGWTQNRLLLEDAAEELASALAALHRFRGRIEAARAVHAARASGVETATPDSLARSSRPSKPRSRSCCVTSPRIAGLHQAAQPGSSSRSRLRGRR